MENVFPYRLYLVVSEENCKGKDMSLVVEQAILGGVDVVQLREKNASEQQFRERALRLKEVLAKHNIPLIINDNLNVAMQINADGVHVGNNDISPSAIRSVWPNCTSIGYSIEHLSQLSNHETQTSNYLGISPVFSTPTKIDTIVEWGLNGISQIRAITEKPLVAIGNMNAKNAFEVIKAGANCIAVVSAICAARDPMKAAYEIRNQIEKAL